MPPTSQIPLELLLLPVELIYLIAPHLLLPDQAALARTCKFLNHLLAPIIWSDIELHHSGTHEGIDIQREIEDFNDGKRHRRQVKVVADDTEYPYKQLVFEPSRRKYAQCHYDPSVWRESFDNYSWREATGKATPFNRLQDFQLHREEKLVGVRRVTSNKRWAELSQYVRSVCMSIGVNDDVAQMLASFSRLRSLELIGWPLEDGHSPTAPEMRFPELQNLKLRGYFPAALVKKICNNAEHIKHLDLGLLSTATDV